MGGISAAQLLIVALIVMLLFGTKKLRSLGGDLGSAISGFKNAIKEDEKEQPSAKSESQDIDKLEHTTAEMIENREVKASANV